MREEAINKIRRDALSLATIVSRYAGGQVEEMFSTLCLITDAFDLEKFDSENNQKLLSHLLEMHRSIGNILIIKPDGSILSSAVFPFDPKTNFSNDEWFRETVKTRQFTIGGLETGPVTKTLGVPFSLPMLNKKGDVQAVVRLFIKLDHFKTLFDLTEYPPPTVLLLFDREGTLLFRNPDPEGWTGKKIPEKQVVAQIPRQRGMGNLEGIGLDNKVRIFGYSTVGPVEHPYFTVGIAIPKKAALSKEFGIYLKGIFFFVVMTILAFAVASFIGEFFVEHRVQNLVKISSRIKEGDLLSRSGPPYVRGEFGTLARSFDEMTETLIQRGKELEKSLRALKTAQEKMIAQERFQALGQMACGIAHDFNNCLTTIIGSADLLLDYPGTLEDKTKAVHLIQTLRESAKDAAQLVARLREFYRPPEERQTPVNLNQLIEHTVELTRPKWKDESLKSGADIHVDTRLNKIPIIWGDESDLREALTNLIFNAVDAMPRGGQLTLESDLKDSEVILKVRDTGTGMSEEVRRHVFEPFFTTKGEKGTGLGLASVYGTVQRHKGFVQIDTEVGKGTSFLLHFPIKPPA